MTTQKGRKKFAQVAIIMGSDSDLKVMQEAGLALDEFKVDYEISIVSAHRTPKEMQKFAESAASRGFKIIIAGAGGAAHLPGMVAAITCLPVIGVPVMTTKLAGLDALLSIAQMPKGVPVACVAVDNAYNAGLLAVRILGTEDKKLALKLVQFQKKQKNKVKKANHALMRLTK
jgi:phosphoribosylaminoimidazole carboxylase PurE protein